MEPELIAYRNLLINAEQKAVEQFDKYVLSLSGGAFGISFSFVNEIVGSDPLFMGWLLGAWVAWGFSITAALFSFYFSHLSLRKAIEQVDAGEIYSSAAGGGYSTMTQMMNAGSAGLFLAGVLCLVVFVAFNAN